MLWKNVANKLRVISTYVHTYTCYRGFPRRIRGKKMLRLIFFFPRKFFTSGRSHYPHAYTRTTSRRFSVSRLPQVFCNTVYAENVLCFWSRLLLRQLLCNKLHKLITQCKSFCFERIKRSKKVYYVRKKRDFFLIRFYFHFFFL